MLFEVFSKNKELQVRELILKLKRLGAKTHYRSTDDLIISTMNKFKESHNFPPTRFCHPDYGDTPTNMDKEFIRQKLNQKYLWTFNDIYHKKHNLKGKAYNIGWQNQCALFADIESSGMLRMGGDYDYVYGAEFIDRKVCVLSK